MGRAGALAASRVVAPAVEQLAAEIFLQGFWQLWQGGYLGCCCLLEQDGQLVLQWGKQLLQPFFADVGLKRLGQDFPGAAVLSFSGGKLGCLFAAQADQAFQCWSKDAEVAAAPCLLPDGIAARLGLGDLGYKRGI